MLLMRLQVGGIDQQVIEVYSNELIEVLVHHVVHVSLPARWSVAKSEWHNLVLVQAVARDEGSHPFVSFLDSEVVEDSDNIELSIEFCLCEMFECFLDKRDRVAVFDYEGIQCTVVHTDPKSSSRLAHNQDQGCAG